MSSTIMDVVIATGFQTLKIVDECRNAQYTGVNTGSSSLILNNFALPMNVITATPSGIRDAIRNVNDLIRGLAGYIGSHSPFLRANASDSAFVAAYMRNIGMNGNSFLGDLGRFTSDIRYVPFARYFASRAGIGVPSSSAVQPLNILHPEPVASGFYAYGNKIRLKLQNIAVNAAIPLAGGLSRYTLHCTGYRIVEAVHGPLPAAANAYDPVPATLSHRIRYLDSTVSILEPFILPLGAPVQLVSGPIHPQEILILEFDGSLRNSDLNDVWIGNYPHGVFIGDHFTQAYIALTNEVSSESARAVCTQVWQTSLSWVPNMSQAGKTTFSAFTNMTMFSKACYDAMEVADNFNAGDVITGKRHMNSLLTFIFAIYTILSYDNYLR